MHRAIYKLKDIMKNRNLHIVSIEPIKKKENETYHIILENNYVLTPGSKDGIIDINDWTGCTIGLYDLTENGVKQLQETCRDIRIEHTGKILSTTRLTSLSIFKKDSNDRIIDFFDGDSEWMITGYILE